MRKNTDHHGSDINACALKEDATDTKMGWVATVATEDMRLAWAAVQLAATTLVMAETVLAEGSAVTASMVAV